MSFVLVLSSLIIISLLVVLGREELAAGGG